MTEHLLSVMLNGMSGSSEPACPELQHDCMIVAQAVGLSFHWPVTSACNGTQPSAQTRVAARPAAPYAPVVLAETGSGPAKLLVRPHQSLGQHMQAQRHCQHDAHEVQAGLSVLCRLLPGP